MGRAKLLPEELRQSNCLALIASEVLMALNVVNDAQHALGKDVNPEAYGIMEHARGHLIRGLEMFSYEVRCETKPDCTIGDYGFNCVDDGTWVCDYCHNLWDKEYHPDFCDEDCPDYMETGKFCSIKIEGGE